MARVLDQLENNKKNSLFPCSRLRNDNKDRTSQELEAAREILAEVFSISVTEVEKMIKQRCEERMQWPERFLSDD